MHTPTKRYSFMSQAIWDILSMEVGEQNSPKGFFRSTPVEVNFEGWVLTFSTSEECDEKYCQVYTRVTSVVPLTDNVGFHLFRRTVFPELAINHQMNPVVSGWDELDRSFALLENQPGVIDGLLRRRRVAELLDQLQAVELSLCPDGDSEGVLTLCAPGSIRQLTLLKKWYDLFAEAADHLCDLGVMQIEESAEVIHS